MEACFQRPAFSANGSATMLKTAESWPACAPESPAGPPTFRLSTAASFQDDSIVPPHPSQQSALPSLADFEGHARCPVIITQDPRASSQVVGTDPKGHIPLNTPVSVETDTFVGRMCNLVRGCPGTPEAVFSGTKVQGKSIIQGMFKSATPAKDLWVGQELLKQPLLPASFQRLVFTTAAKMFSSTYRVMVEGEGDVVGYLNPLLALATTINVSLPGRQPDLRSVYEDARLLDSRLADKSGRPVPSVQRQRFFDKPSNLAQVVFEPQYVYTFVITQSIVDMPTYKLKLGAFINLDLCPILNGQPLQMMCKNVQTDQVIMSLLVWHKHLNYPPGRQSRHSRASSQDASDSSSISGLCSNGSRSSLYTDSSTSSLSSMLGDCCVDSSVGADSISESDDECESADGCDSDYHSCFGDDDDPGHYQAGPDQQQHTAAASTWGLEQGHTAAAAAAAAAAMAGPVQRPRLLETALTAPAELITQLGEEADADAPVQVTVLPASSLGLDAAAVTGAAAQASHLAVSGKPRKASRTSTGSKAVAAVASAARRAAARLRGRPPTPPRRNKSCSGLAL